MQTLIDNANARTGIFAKFKPEQRANPKRKSRINTQSERTQTTATQDPQIHADIDEAAEAEEWLREAMITAYIPD